MYIKLRELIVTQWDVNDLHLPVARGGYNELIVTQWDVNNVKISCNQTEQIELIVTQWDVNMIVAGEGGATTGINSYIVGCKFQ